MGRHLIIRPREAWAIRNTMATQVAAHALAALPIGYWQRRVAARAWSLESMPVVPRESQVVRARRHPGPVVLWTLTTDVMAWGLIPWLWQADARTEVGEARLALNHFARTARRPSCAALFVAPHGVSGPRTLLPRLRLQARRTDVDGDRVPGRAEADWLLSMPMAIGVITWPELVEVFTEASADADSLRARRAAEYGADQLTRLAQASDR